MLRIRQLFQMYLEIIWTMAEFEIRKNNLIISSEQLLQWNTHTCMCTCIHILLYCIYIKFAQ